MLLKNQWVNDEIQEKIKNTLRQMTMKTQPYIQTLWEGTNGLLRGKFIMIQAFLKKQEKPQIKTYLMPTDWEKTFANDVITRA